MFTMFINLNIKRMKITAYFDWVEIISEVKEINLKVKENNFKEKVI